MEQPIDTVAVRYNDRRDQAIELQRISRNKFLVIEHIAKPKAEYTCLCHVLNTDCEAGLAIYCLSLGEAFATFNMALERLD